MDKITYEIIQEYINSTITGNGCKLLMSKEEFLKEKVIQSHESKYNKSNPKIKLKMQCNCDDKNIFYTTFSNFKNNNKRQCNKCGKQIQLKNIKFTYKYVKDYVENNSNCKIISKEYINVDSELDFECECGNPFKRSFAVFKRSKKKCNECTVKDNGSYILKSQEQFNNEVFNLVGNEYTVLGKYINSQTKLLIRHNCKECNNNEWDIIPSSFVNQNTRCPKCSNNVKSNTEEFKKKVYDLVGDEYTVLGEYENNVKKILIRHNCKDCNNNEYEVSPSKFTVCGRRCPACNESKGEQFIRHYCEENEVPFDPQYIFDDLIGDFTVPLKFDFIIFKEVDKINLRFLIEYDGEFHYKAIKNYKGEPIEFVEARLAKQKRFDKKKDDYCKEHNISLLRIPYWEFHNIERILDEYLEIDNKLNIDDLIKAV